MSICIIYDKESLLAEKIKDGKNKRKYSLAGNILGEGYKCMGIEKMW